MEMLRLPLVGDYVYASVSGEPDTERKYIVTGISDDGYYIEPEDESSKEPSQIKYLFGSQKWVVIGGEKKFNIRIEMNPALRDIPDMYDHQIQITDAISHGRLEDADNLINAYQRFDIPRMLTSTIVNEINMYEIIFEVMERSDTDIIQILGWLKRNHMIDYHLLLRVAIVGFMDDVIGWVLDQNVDLFEGFGRDKVGQIWDVVVDEVIVDEVIPNEVIDIMQLLSRFSGLFDAFDGMILGNKHKEDDPSNLLEFVERRFPESVDMLEFLRSVPPKPVQSKHLY